MDFKKKLKVAKAFLIFLKDPLKTEVAGFSDKVSNDSNLKILMPKQILQRLSIALAQVKAGNTSENLLDEIRQIIYFFLSSKRNH